jgi:hypothetical protein
MLPWLVTATGQTSSRLLAARLERSSSAGLSSITNHPRAAEPTITRTFEGSEDVGEMTPERLRAAAHFLDEMAAKVDKRQGTSK